MKINTQLFKLNFALPTLFTLVMALPQANAKTKAEAYQRADASLNTLMTHYWDNNKKTFTIGGGYWYYAQALDAAVMAEARVPSKSNKDRVDLLFNSQKQRGFLQQKGQIYYDDENWMAMALLRAYSIRRNPEFLKAATDLFNDIAKAEMQDGKGNSFGIWWSDSHTLRATASNMGPVITAAMLYRITKNENYLKFAKRVYTHWHREMVIHDTWQVVDNINTKGGKTFVPMTYNQGLAVGAALALYKLTGDYTYITHATGYAQYVLKNMTNNGILVEKICVGRVAECRKNKDLVQFKGITYRYLVLLALNGPKNNELDTMLDRTANALWTIGRDAKTGLFAHEWDGEDKEAFDTFSSSASAALALGGHARFMLKTCDYL